MKIAVIGYDQTLKVLAPLLHEQGHAVSYFIHKPDQDLKFRNFWQIPILVDRLMIPSAENQQTTQQKRVFNKMLRVYSELQRRLTSTADKFSDRAIEAAPAELMALDIQTLDQVVDISTDTKTRKVIIEIENKGIERFDFLICESHSILSQLLGDKGIEINQNQKKPKYIWASFGFDYELMKPLEQRHVDRDFLLVADSSRESIVDNWFYCQMTSNHINFWSYFPESQLQNPEFQDFYIDRIRSIAGVHLPFVQMKEFNQTLRSTNDFDLSVMDSGVVVRNQILFVPNMGFWSIEQLKPNFISPLIKTLKKLKPGIEAQA